jgi:hypothetical protein
MVKTTRPRGRKAAKKAKVEQIHRMSEEELSTFVDDFCSDRIFTDLHVEGDERTKVHLIPHIFLPLFLMGLPYSKREQKNVGRFWEFRSAAMPMSCNGFPMFPSVRVMHKKDWEVLWPALKLELNRREALKVSKPKK